MDNAKKFFEELIKTEEAKALFKAAEKPESNEARVVAYIDIAKKLGVELTAEKIDAYFASANKAHAEELDSEELSQLVGGGDTCSASYVDRENCWGNDGCDYFNNSYTNYSCSWSYKGACVAFDVSDSNRKPDGRPLKFG